MVRTSLIVILVSLLAASIVARECGHSLILNYTPKEQLVQKVPQQYSSRETPSLVAGIELDSVVRQPIRIYFETSTLDSDPNTCTRAGQRVTLREGIYTCTTDDILTQQKKNFIVNQLLPAARNFFYTALRVAPVQGNLKISTSTCGGGTGVSVPSSLSNVGVPNADIVLFVTARPTTGNVIAWATDCQQDQNNRPIAGQVNFGPGKVDINKLEDQLDTAVHEITHALGFSSSKFDENMSTSMFVDSAGNAIPTSSVIVRSSVIGRSALKIKTPRVLNFIRSHFGCPSLDGAELENSGGSGTSSSHWDKRVFMNEVMTGSDSQHPIYSALTLAFLEDTGYYTANYKVAQKLYWGANQGCSFALESCSRWSGNYFCRDSNRQPACGGPSITGRYKSYCNLVSYTSPLPRENQYFTDSKMGGSDQLADFCPYYSAFSNGDCTDASNVKGELESTGQYYGPGSGCFLATVLKQNFCCINQPQSACYKFSCSTDGSQLQVQVGTTWYKCPAQGGQVTVGNGFTGTINCPPAKDYCKDFVDPAAGCAAGCAATGTCQSGTCVCMSGFSGSDCSQAQCPNGCSGKGTCSNGQCNCQQGSGGADCSLSIGGGTQSCIQAGKNTNGDCAVTNSCGQDYNIQLACDTSNTIYNVQIPARFRGSIPDCSRCLLRTVKPAAASFIHANPEEQQ